MHKTTIRVENYDTLTRKQKHNYGFLNRIAQLLNFSIWGWVQNYDEAKPLFENKGSQESIRLVLDFSFIDLGHLSSTPAKNHAKCD